MIAAWPAYLPNGALSSNEPSWPSTLPHLHDISVSEYSILDLAQTCHCCGGHFQQEFYTRWLSRRCSAPVFELFNGSRYPSGAFRQLFSLAVSFSILGRRLPTHCPLDGPGILFFAQAVKKIYESLFRRCQMV